MERLTKRELIDKFVEIMERDNLDNMRPLDWLKAKEEAYNEAEKLAKESNIVGTAFENLWKQACTIRQRKLGIRA